MNDENLGTLENPCSHFDLHQAIIGRKDCTIYTRETFKINDDEYAELKARNIKLCSLGFLHY